MPPKCSVRNNLVGSAVASPGWRRYSMGSTRTAASQTVLRARISCQLVRSEGVGPISRRLRARCVPDGFAKTDGHR